MSSGLLSRVPTPMDLERLYWELARHGAPSVGRRRGWPYHPQSLEDLLVLAAEMLRYDPRLLGILVQLVVEHEAELDPRRLRARMQSMRWPQTLLVVFELAREATREREVHYMADYVAKGHRRLEPPERFFIDAEVPGSRLARRKLGRDLRAYTRWGFLGTERPTVDAFRKRTVGRLDAASRRRLAERLVQEQGALTMTEYLELVGDGVSRQQAASDLRTIGLVPSGRGRGAVWRPA
ncbi:MAG: hypothetical protein KF729_24415 [Sandaracinaceae bacterium]|nr:hypothetical protein [Sandaracinaceae bacterium]